jgi:hypothetical protein
MQKLKELGKRFNTETTFELQLSQEGDETVNSCIAIRATTSVNWLHFVHGAIAINSRYIIIIIKVKMAASRHLNFARISL